MVIDSQTVEEVIGILTAIGSGWLFVRKLLKDRHKAKKEEADNILKQAKKEDQELRVNMDNKIHMLDIKLATLEANVNKDMQYLKESYKTELKNLGERIENLRTELAAQHGSLLNLLTKVVK